jgi:hypothetical protein
MQYAELIDGAVQQIFQWAPESYKNISNFNALTTERMADLTWAGLPGVKFYEYHPTPQPSEHCCYSVEYVVDHDNKVVTDVLTPLPPTVPDLVTATQLRLWFVRNGVSMSAVEAALGGIGDATLREELRITWEYSIEIARTGALMAALAAGLGLTSEQVDAAFLAAAKLTR